MASYNLRKSDKMDYNELAISNYHKQKEFAIIPMILTNFIAKFNLKQQALNS